VQQALGDSDNAPARPHFADFLVQAGYVRDRAEAFRKWLGAGKLGDVKQHWPSLQQAVACLRAAGAWVSLAHPMHYEMTRSKRRRLVSEFIAAGGQGLEVSNGLQPAEQVGSLAILAREFGLLASAGSDFHAQTAWSEPGWYRPLPDDCRCSAIASPRCGRSPDPHKALGLPVAGCVHCRAWWCLRRHAPAQGAIR